MVVSGFIVVILLYYNRGWGLRSIYYLILEGVKLEVLGGMPVVLLHGHRQAGKSTLAQEIGGEKYKYISFDDNDEVSSAKSDPRGYVESLSNFVF